MSDLADRGWIPAYRKLYDPSHILAPSKRDPSNRRDAWLDLCQMAQHAPRTHHGERLERGEALVAVRTKAEHWGWSKSRVSRFLLWLASEAMIGTVRGTPYGTVYRIVNYDTYAVAQNTERDTPRDTEWDASGTAAGQEQQLKHSRKQKLVRSEVAEIFEYWVGVRHQALSLNGAAKPKLTAKRASSVNARLDEGYEVESLKRAVDGCFASEFHVVNGHTDLELIMRDQAHVDRFLLKADRPTNANPKARGRL